MNEENLFVALARDFDAYLVTVPMVTFEQALAEGRYWALSLVKKGKVKP